MISFNNLFTKPHAAKALLAVLFLMVSNTTSSAQLCDDCGPDEERQPITITATYTSYCIVNLQYEANIKWEMESTPCDASSASTGTQSAKRTVLSQCDNTGPELCDYSIHEPLMSAGWDGSRWSIYIGCSVDMTDPPGIELPTEANGGPGCGGGTHTEKNDDGDILWVAVVELEGGGCVPKDEITPSTCDPVQEDEEGCPEPEGDSESQEVESGTGLESDEPVALLTGHKIERATDVSVPLPGRDFVLRREYSSDPDLFDGEVLSNSGGAGEVGRNWALSTSIRLQVPSQGFSGSGGSVIDAHLVGSPLRSVLRFRNGSPTGLSRGGLKSKTIGTDDCYGYGMPSGAAKYFFSDYDTDPESSLTGRLRQEVDEYGNEWNYEWDTIHSDDPSGSHTSRPRLRKIYLNGDSTSNLAVVEFDWHEWISGPNAVDAFLFSRLKEVRVKRGSDVVQTVQYKYAGETGYDTAVLGKLGSLVEVINTTPVFASGASSETDRDRVTQYRYTSFIDGQTAIETGEDQLTAVFYPDDIEYYADEHGQLSSAYTSILDAAKDLREIPLDTASGATGYPKFPATFPLPNLYSIASKLVNYDDATDRVSDQYLSGGSCGCSGSSALGKRLSYSYDEYYWNLGNVGNNPYRRGRTTKVSEFATNLSGSTSLVKRTLYDYIDYSVPKLTSRPALDGRGAFYQVAEATSNLEGPDNWHWATKYERHVIPAPAQNNEKIYKRLSRRSTPASTKYIEKTTSGTPFDTRHIDDVSILPQGIVHNFSQTPDPVGAFRVGEQIVEKGVLGADASTLVEKRYEYGTLTTARPDLVTKIITPTTDSTRTVDLWYGLRNTSEIAWRSETVALDDEAQNGPGTGDAVTYSLYDDEGLLRWIRTPDGTLEYREYDSSTGRVTKIRRNAKGDEGTGTIAALNATNFSGIADIGTWGDSNNVPLETTYTYDLLGRMTSSTSPAGASTYVRREMRTADTADSSSTRGVPYYAEVALPHELSSGGYNGPASLTWMDAANRPIQTSQYTVSTASGSFNPLADDGSTTPYILDTEQARVSQERSHAGVVNVAREWHTMPATPSTCYETSYTYDGAGRLVQVEDPEGGSTWYGNPQATGFMHDLLGRVKSVYVGVASSPNTAIKIAEYFYDLEDPDDGLAGLYVGNGSLTLERRYTGETDNSQPVMREIRRWYDWRDRLVAIENPEAPHQSFEYDDQSRMLESATWSGGSFVPTESGFETSSASVTIARHWATNGTSGSYPAPGSGTLADRTTYSETKYSDRGFAYRQSVAIDPSSGSTGFLETNRWHDERGRMIAEWGPNQPTRKIEYDALSRPSVVRLTDRNGDASPDATGNHVDASAITNDAVIEQTEFRYAMDSTSGLDTGLLDLISTSMRWHDIADTVHGALDGNNSLTTHRGTGYDDAGRLIASYWFGADNGTDPYFASGMAAPTAADFAVWDSLKSTTEYDDWGRVLATVSPAGTRTEYKLDPLSRQVAVIEAADQVDADDITWNGSAWTVNNTLLSQDKDRVTSFIYDGLGNVVKRTAHVDTSNNQSNQTTEYVYGTIAGSESNVMDSLVSTSGLLGEIRYPDETTGLPGTTSEYTVSYAYNALGELRGMTDQNGTIHKYDRDDLGRIEHDRVTTLGTDVNDHVRRISNTYDTSGRLATVLSYSDESPSSGTVRNGVSFGYSPLHRITQTTQNNDGDPASGGLAVKYVYDDEGPAAQSSPDYESKNYSRLTGIEYPGQSTETLELEYATGLNDRINRLTSMTAEGVAETSSNNYGKMVEYEYLGYGMFANTSYPNAKTANGSTHPLSLDRAVNEIGEETAGVYPAYDEYGRVRFHAWTREGTFVKQSGASLPEVPPLIARMYEYDDDSNRVRDDDGRPGILPEDRDWRYLYDDLNRLSEAVRGQNSAGTGPHAMDVQPGSRQWSLDVLGNWDSLIVDEHDVDTPNYLNDEVQGRLFNDANEITEISTTPFGGSSTVISEPLHDKNGNYTSNRDTAQAGAKKYTYDAWNRLVKVEMWTTGTNHTIGEYAYNGLHWRTKRKADTSQGAYDGINEHRDYYYSTGWQLLEEHVDHDGDGNLDGNADRKARQFWGARYIDDAVARDVDWNGDDTWTDARDFYYLTDALFSVRALTDREGQVVERVDYTPYGEAIHRHAHDFDESGVYNVDDHDIFVASATSGGPGNAGYDPDVDFDGTGFNNDDTDHYVELVNHGPSSLPSGWIADPEDSYFADNSIGYAGYRFNLENEQYQVRFRVYDPGLGRWMQREPVGTHVPMNPRSQRPFVYAQYDFGSSLLEYAQSEPVMGVDPLGLSPLAPIDLGDGYRGRIDPMPRPGGRVGFHLHVYQKCDGEMKMVAQVTERGGFRMKHGSQPFRRPASSFPKETKKNINRAIKGRAAAGAVFGGLATIGFATTDANAAIATIYDGQGKCKCECQVSEVVVTKPTVVQSLTHSEEIVGGAPIGCPQSAGYVTPSECFAGSRLIAEIEEGGDLSFTVYRQVWMICQPNMGDCCD